MGQETPALRQQGQECADANLIMLRVSFQFLGRIHDLLPAGVLRDVVGQLYFGEEISPENKSALHYEGINASLIFINNRGNKS